MLLRPLLRAFLILVMAFVVVYILLALYISQFVHTIATNPADVAIVLGARAYLNHHINPCLQSRMDTALALYKENRVSSLLFSGGTDKEDGVNEAKTMEKIALNEHIPQNYILLETESTSTFENLNNSQEILQEKNINSAIIITEPYHMARTRLIARTLNLNAEFVTAETSPCWNRWKYASRYFLKEPFVILYYLLSDKISIRAF